MNMPTVTPAQYALASILQGQSANQGLTAYRESGGHIANQTWYRLRGELEATIAAREGVYNEPQHLRPVAAEIQAWSTPKAKGYVQQVEVLVRERETGTVISVPYSAMSSILRSRQAIVREALSVYSDTNAEKYNQQILGAVYTGTYQATPEGA
jgi:hypothetical protein